MASSTLILDTNFENTYAWKHSSKNEWNHIIQSCKSNNLKYSFVKTFNIGAVYEDVGASVSQQQSQAKCDNEADKRQNPFNQKHE